MLITNQKIIVASGITEAIFKEIITEMTDNAQQLYRNKDIKFPFVLDPYPHCLNESQLLFTELKEACGDGIDLQFRAIGDESVQLPGARTKTVKHVYSVDEKQVIADDICRSQLEKESLEDEKKQSNKSYNSKLEKIESLISKLASDHRVGSEDRDKECYVIYNFEEKVKNYIDTTSGELVHVENLVDSDYQMRIDQNPGFVPDPENEDVFENTNTEPEIEEKIESLVIKAKDQINNDSSEETIISEEDQMEEDNSKHESKDLD